jgi:hypothetical protein
MSLEKNLQLSFIVIIVIQVVGFVLLWNKIPSQAASQTDVVESQTNLDAMNNITAIIDNALKRGVWTSQDMLGVMPDAPYLTNPQRVEIMQRLNRAITDNKLILQEPVLGL